MLKPSDFRFFLDSGAYSAWSQGLSIDLDEYCEFIRSNLDQIEVYASLDVIPGKPGQQVTTKQRDEAAEQSWANYCYMVAQGFDPLPVYHYGEDVRFLDRLLAHGCDYIGIGGLVGIPSALRRVWLDRVFERLTDEMGDPIVKTHGFGMTSVPLIFRYPWYSVDSTTWIKITANGGIYLPAMRDREFVFDEVPATITVSERSTKQSTSGKHSNSLSGAMREVLDRWLTICGKTYEEVHSDYAHRAVCNVMYFKMVSESKASRKFNRKAVRPGGLLA